MILRPEPVDFRRGSANNHAQHQDTGLTPPANLPSRARWLAPQGADAAGRQRNGCRLIEPSGASWRRRVSCIQPPDSPHAPSLNLGQVGNALCGPEVGS